MHDRNSPASLLNHEKHDGAALEAAAIPGGGGRGPKEPARPSALHAFTELKIGTTTMTNETENTFEKCPVSTISPRSSSGPRWRIRGRQGH